LAFVTDQAEGLQTSVMLKARVVKVKLSVRKEILAKAVKQ